MLVMLALSRLPGLSVYGVSIGGAAGHNIGQSRRDFVGIRRVDGGKIEKRVTCSGIHWQWMGMWVRALARCWP